MKNKLIFILLFCSSTYQVIGQKKDSIITSNLALGIGVPQLNFRDNVSSSLSYRGIGLGEFNFSKMKTKSNCIKSFNFNIGVGAGRPNVKNKTDWNTASNVYFYDIGYSYLSQLKVKRNDVKTKFYLGGKIGSNAEVSTYPVINNVATFNLNWLSIAPSGIMTHDFQIRKTASRLTYQLTVPIYALNVRPLSYVGLLPAENVWSQEDDLGGAFTSGIKQTSLHNNLTIHSTLHWDLYKKKNKLRLTYDWLLYYNTRAVNSLIFIKSSVTLSYLIQLNKKA